MKFRVKGIIKNPKTLEFGIIESSTSTMTFVNKNKILNPFQEFKKKSI